MLRFRPLLIPTLWFLPGLALLAGLGVWQIERLHQKDALIAAVDARIHAAPIPIEDALRLPPGEAEWRHVSASGFPMPDRDAYVFAQGPHGQPGVQIITPFVLPDMRIVLVNRGFVPEAQKKEFAISGPAKDVATTVTGILRVSVKPGLFTPDPDAAERLWFSKDAPAIATAMGVNLAAAVFVEADAGPDPNIYPLGGQTIVDFPNDHLQYAITWFGLALSLMAVYLLYHRSRGRLSIG